MNRAARAIGWLLAATAIVAPACSGNRGASSSVHAIPEDAKSVAISVRGFDCAECSDLVEGPLRAEPGVYDVKFDRKRVVFTVMAAPSIDPQRLLSIVRKAGFEAELGDRGGSYLPPDVFPQDADARVVVDDGRDVADLATVTVTGKITLVDFFAPWCGPCREVDAHMKKLLVKGSDVAYRKLDIVDWDSPLAQHQLNGVPNLPYVIVFDAHGAKVDAISGLDLQRLDAAIEKARSKSTPAAPAK